MLRINPDTSLFQNPDPTKRPGSGAAGLPLPVWGGGGCNVQGHFSASICPKNKIKLFVLEAAKKFRVVRGGVK